MVAETAARNRATNERMLVAVSMPATLRFMAARFFARVGHFLSDGRYDDSAALAVSVGVS